MRKFSLDSSIIISYLKGDKKAKELLDIENRRFLLPSIVEMEIKWGKKDIGEFENLNKLNFSSEEVEECIEIKQYLKSRGDMINRLDIMIAAQAITSNSILITADKDFEKLEEYGGFRYKTVTLD